MGERANQVSFWLMLTIVALLATFGAVELVTAVLQLLPWRPK
jgi:hypothetical protein